MYFKFGITEKKYPVHLFLFMKRGKAYGGKLCMKFTQVSVTSLCLAIPFTKWLNHEILSALFSVYTPS